MEIEIAGLVGFVFAATSVGALVYERQMDVLHGSRIQAPVQPQISISSISNPVLFLAGLAASVPKSLIISAVVLAITVAGCAHNRPQPDSNLVRHEVRAGAVRATLPTDKNSERYAQSRNRRTVLALLAPQPAPDCEFKESDPKTVDPNEWPRLKLEYERQCYKDAEKAVRKRLRLLQTSGTCEIPPVEHGKPSGNIALVARTHP